MNDKGECGKCVFPDDHSRRVYLHATLIDLCCAFGDEFDCILSSEGEREFVDNVVSLLQLFIDRGETFVPEPLNTNVFSTTASTVKAYLLQQDYRSLRAFLWASVITNGNGDCNFDELPFVFLALVFVKSTKRLTRLTLKNRENLNLEGELDSLIRKTTLDCDCLKPLCCDKASNHIKWMKCGQIVPTAEKDLLDPLLFAPSEISRMLLEHEKWSLRIR